MISKKQPGKLHILQLAAVIFLTVSGGPYGLESLLHNAGGYWAFILLIITPLLWDIPAILAVMELNSMMPVAGGYYQWVKRGLGRRYAFYEGWWTWLYTFIDLAIYPVLFVTYASFLLPGIIAYKIPVCLLIIWVCAGLNIRGILPVARVSMILGIIILLPFLLLILYAVQVPAPAMAEASQPTSFSSMGMSLYIIMWNFIGWDNVTTYADEIEHPRYAYLKATAIAFILIVILYLLTTWAAWRSGINVVRLSEEGFPVLGMQLAGHWLAILLAAGGMASTLGLFSAVLLSVSRIPKVMAEDGLLPALLYRLHKQYQTPYLSVIICASVVSAMVLFSFSDLLLMDIIIYGAGLFLEFISLIILRLKEPEVLRPFRIPLGIKGLICLFLLPVLVYAVALSGILSETSDTGLPVILAIGALLSAEPAWQIIKRYQGKQ